MACRMAGTAAVAAPAVASSRNQASILLAIRQPPTPLRLRVLGGKNPVTRSHRPAERSKFHGAGAIIGDRPALY